MAKDSGGGFSTGLILGAIIGTVAGILMAPKPGSETRSELIEKSDYWREKAENLSELVVERLGPTLETVRDNVPPTIENMKSRVDPLIEQVNSRFINTDPNSTKISDSEEADRPT
tara:strand:+ start:160 stop:504 length:345 start_codon:yes stop_codon:yes gene_type:complete